MVKLGSWVVRAAVGTLLGASGCAPKTSGSSAKVGADTVSARPSGQPADIEVLLRHASELARENRLTEAEAAFRQAVQLAREQQPFDANQFGRAVAALGNWLLAQRRSSETRPLLVEALSHLGDGTLESDRRAFQLQMILGESFRYEKQSALALEPFQKAVGLAFRHETELRDDLLEASRRLVVVQKGQGRVAEAIALLQRLLQVPVFTETQRASLRFELAATYSATGDWARAVELAGGHPVTARVLNAADRSITNVEPTTLLPQPAPAPIAEGVSPSVAGTAPAPMNPKTGAVSNAALRVAEMRAGFRACYQLLLATDPEAQGAVRLTIRVVSDGSVARVEGLSLGLQADAVDCLLRRAAQAVFEPPEGGSAVIQVPVTFVKQ